MIHYQQIFKMEFYLLFHYVNILIQQLIYHFYKIILIFMKQYLIVYVPYVICQINHLIFTKCLLYLLKIIKMLYIFYNISLIILMLKIYLFNYLHLLLI